MSRPAWLERLCRTLEIGEELEIFFLVGPPELARPALERVAEATRGLLTERWHRLHAVGLEGLFDAGGTGRSVRLVHGLERMRRPAAERASAVLNVNRDALALSRDVYVLWIPTDFLDEFLRAAPDLLAWRSGLIEIDRNALDLDPQRELIELLLARAWTAAPSHAPSRDVELSTGEVLALVDWIAEPKIETLAVGPANEAGHDGRLAALASARILADRAELFSRPGDRAEGDPTRPVPLSLVELWDPRFRQSSPPFDLAVVELRLPHRLYDPLRRLWSTDRLQLLCERGDDPPSRRRLVFRRGDDTPRLAPLSDAQVRFMATTLLLEADQDISEWSPFVEGLIVATRDHRSQRSAWFIDGVIEVILDTPAPLDYALHHINKPSSLTGLEDFFRYDYNRTPWDP